MHTYIVLHDQPTKRPTSDRLPPPTDNRKPATRSIRSKTVLGEVTVVAYAVEEEQDDDGGLPGKSDSGASHAAVIVELIEGIFSCPRPSPESRLLARLVCLARLIVCVAIVTHQMGSFPLPSCAAWLRRRKEDSPMHSSVAVARAAQSHRSIHAGSHDPGRTDGDGHEDCRQTRITPMTQLVTKWDREGQKL